MYIANKTLKNPHVQSKVLDLKFVLEIDFHACNIVIPLLAHTYPYFNLQPVNDGSSKLKSLQTLLY